MKVIVQKSEDALKTLHLISNLTIKNIIEYLKKGPAPPSKIAREVNISPSTVSRCLQEMRKYNIVSASWKTSSVDERPLKIFRLVPNVLRFEYMIKKPETKPIKPEHVIGFAGNCLAEFKEDDMKGVYTSMESVPFRFDGIEAEIIKASLSEPSFSDMKKRFKDNSEFEPAFQRLVNLGIIQVKSSD